MDLTTEIALQPKMDLAMVTKHSQGLSEPLRNGSRETSLAFACTGGIMPLDSSSISIWKRSFKINGRSLHEPESELNTVIDLN